MSKNSGKRRPNKGRRSRDGAAGARQAAATPSTSRPGVAGTLLGLAGQAAAGQGPDPVVLAERAHKQGRLSDAEIMYKDILKREPGHVRAMTLYGIVLNHREKHEQAVRMFRASLKRAPNQAEALNGLGTAYRSLGRLPEAIAAYRQALDVDPEFAGIHSNMGTAFREAGDFEAAVESYETALGIDPSIAEAWNGLARTRKFTEVPPQFAELERTAETPGLPSLARRHAYFALGKICDDIGRYDDAFAYYGKANELRAAPADASRDCRLMAFLAGAYPANGGREPAAGEMHPSGSVPVFVLGMPRSGTTLVEQIVASHPQAVGGGELNVFTAEARRLGIGPSAQDLPVTAPSLSKADIRRIRKSFFARFRGDQAVGKRPKAVVDKTPFNFLYIGLIAQAMPEAKIVHCSRDPLDTGLSIYFTDFAANQPFTTSLETIGQYIGCYRKMMAHWRKAAVLPMLDLPYEDLVNDQEAMTRELIAFCGLPWDERCLSYHRTDRHVSTPSDWQVRQPMYRGSVERWRRYDAHLAPLKAALEQ